MQRLINTSVDSRVFTLSINEGPTEINIDDLVNNVNRSLDLNNYNNALVGLKALKTIITIRTTIIREWYNGLYVKAGKKVPGTNLTAPWILKNYKLLTDQIDLLLPEVEEHLDRIRRLVRAAEDLRIREDEEAEQRQADNMIRRQQIFSVMAQIQRREREEFFEQDLVNSHFSSLLRQMRETQIRNTINAVIKIRVYVGSDTRDNAAYIITNDEDLHAEMFGNLHEKTDHYKEVSYQAVTPIFDVSPEPFRLTFFDGAIHNNPNAISITNPVDVETIKDTFLDILNTDDEFYENNAWYKIIIPQTLSSRTRILPQDPRSSELRTQVNALTQREIDNYPVFSDKNFPHIYFVNTPKIHDDNCLVNELIDHYSFLSNNSGIAKSTIKKFFQKHPPTIGSLKKFCDKDHFNISLTILDYAESVMVQDVKKGSKRQAIAFMVHENHVQKYIGDLRSPLDLSTAPTEGYRDTRKLFNFKPPKELTTLGLGKGRRSNFAYEFQRNLRYKSMMYEAPDVFGEHEVQDIAKAFYTCVKNAPPEQSIPKYQVGDLYKPYRNEKIKSFYEYVFKDTIYEKINFNKGKNALGAQTTNIMMGYRVRYEINMGRIDQDDISHVRIATDHGKMKDLQDLLSNIDPDNFKYINGIFGKTSSGTKTLTFNVQFNDLRLLLANTPDLEYVKLPSGQFKVTKTFSHGKYRYLNNFDYYNFVIELCNYNLTKKIDEMMAANIPNLPDLRITKIWVDCVGFNHPACRGVLNTAPLNSDNIKFKSESSYFSGTMVNFKCYDPEVLNSKAKEELKSFLDTSIFVGGGSGLGKTYWALRNIPHDYRVSFKNKNVVRISKDDRGEATNKPGQTIHKAFLLCNLREFYKHSSKTYRNKTVLVDEVSDVSSFMWSVFFTCHKLYNTKFVFVGDFKQVPPFGEIPDRTDYFWNSMDQRTILPPPRPDGEQRCEPALRELCNALRDNPYHPIPEYLFHTQFYPEVNNHFPFRRNLMKEGNNKTVAARGYSFSPPSRGLSVTATKNEKSSRYVNAEVFTVLDFWDPNVTLRSEDDTNENDTPKVITISYVKYLKNFRPAYFQTIHSSQGGTIDGVICIYEIDKLRRCPTAGALLYTILSRARTMSQLRLYHTYPANFNVERTICEDLRPKSYLKLKPNRVTVIPRSGNTLDDAVRAPQVVVERRAPTESVTDILLRMIG